MSDIEAETDLRAQVEDLKRKLRERGMYRSRYESEARARAEAQATLADVSLALKRTHAALDAAREIETTLAELLNRIDDLPRRVPADFGDDEAAAMLDALDAVRAAADPLEDALKSLRLRMDAAPKPAPKKRKRR